MNPPPPIFIPNPTEASQEDIEQYQLYAEPTIDEIRELRRIIDMQRRLPGFEDMVRKNRRILISLLKVKIAYFRVRNTEHSKTKDDCKCNCCEGLLE